MDTSSDIGPPGCDMVLSNRGSPQLYWCQGQPGIVVMIQFIASVRDSMQGVQFESSE